jgi:hypothetical protein
VCPESNPMRSQREAFENVVGSTSRHRFVTRIRCTRTLACPSNRMNALRTDRPAVYNRKGIVGRALLKHRTKIPSVGSTARYVYTYRVGFDAAYYNAQSFVTTCRETALRRRADRKSGRLIVRDSWADRGTGCAADATKRRRRGRRIRPRQEGIRIRTDNNTFGRISHS